MSAGQEKTFSRQFFGCLWTLIKLTITLVLAVALGAGVYVGGVYVYQGILAPISSNTWAIESLQRELERTRGEVDEDLTQLSERLNEHEVSVRELERTLTALQDDLETIAGQLEDFKEEIAAQREQITTLEEALSVHKDNLASLEEGLTAQGEHLDELQAGLDDVEAGVNELQAGLEEITSLVVPPVQELARLRVQTMLLQMRGEVLKARLSLLQGDQEQAQQELALAAETLALLGRERGDELFDEIALLSGLLSETRRDLAAGSFAAIEELETLWQAVDGLLARVSAPEFALTLSPTVTVTLPITPTIPITATPTITPTVPGP